MSFENTNTQTKSVFDAIQSKQAFWIGFVTAILSIGTLGFIILGSCVLSGDCSFERKEVEEVVELDEKNAVGNGEATAPVVVTGVPLVTEADHIQGDANAEITIITYTDFECPYCKRFHPTMKQVMEEYNGKVRWVLRDFPLSFHANAASAANAVECAGELGKYWEFTDKIFESSELGKDAYVKIATDLGLNADTFTKCVDDNKYADSIDTEADGGAAAGVSGTPASFIIDKQGNATPIKGALPFDSIASALDGMIGK